MYRHAVVVEAGSWYRVDTASGSSTPTSVLQPDGVTTVPNAFGLTGSTVHNETTQNQALFLSTVQTLYLKRLTYQGVVAGDTPITSVGQDLTPVPDPSTGSDVAALLAALSPPAPVASTATSGTLTTGAEHTLSPTGTASWTLPTGVAANSRPTVVKNNGTANVAVARGGSDTINAGTSSVTVAPGEWARFTSNGSGAWTASGTYGQTAAYAPSSGSTAYVPKSPNSIATWTRQDFVPFGALRPAKAALAASYSTPCRVLAMGDSMIEGFNASSYTTRLTHRLGVRLRQAASLPAGGAGFIPTLSNRWSGGNWPFATAGTTVPAAGYGIAGTKVCQFTGTSGNGLDLTVPAGTTGVDIIGIKYTAGWSFTWAVDGGSTTTATIGTNSTALDGQVLAQIRGLSAGGHTISIRGASGTCFIDGAMLYVGDESAGVHIIEAGISGWKTTNLAALTGDTKLGLVTSYAPQVVIIEALVNNYNDGSSQTVSSTQTVTDLQTIISNIRTRYTAPALTPTPTAYGPAFILTPPWQRTTGGATTEAWSAYVNACYTVAQNDAMGLVSVFDMGGRFNPTSQQNHARVYGLMDTDGVHPTDAGCDAWAQQLASWLTAS